MIVSYPNVITLKVYILYFSNYAITIRLLFHPTLCFDTAKLKSAEKLSEEIRLVVLTHGYIMSYVLKFQSHEMLTCFKLKRGWFIF